MKRRVLDGKLTPGSCKTGDKSSAIYHGMFLIPSKEAIREGISFCFIPTINAGNPEYGWTE